MAKNVFVPGLTDLQRRELETIRNADQYAFHDLVGFEPLTEPDVFVFSDILERARAELAAFDGSIDAIVAHWDFPTSVLAPILAQENGIPAPSLESVLKCEHKYWSRLEQSVAVPDHVPRFFAFDPFDDDVCADIGLRYPFWVKPVKSHSSHLGFKIENDAQLEEALDEIREEIGNVGHAFDEVLAMVDLPPAIKEAPGTTCLAEEIMTGIQAAPEGSMFRGRFDVHGIFDMRLDDRNESIVALDYPARNVPDEIQEEMVEVSERYLRHVGFDNGCFNVEFLWEPETNDLCIIEVNTRMSQSHSDLFAKVNGMSNHEVAVDIALGQEPSLPDRGEYAVAAKCILLHHDDGIVTRVPTDDEIAELAERFPGTVVDLSVEPGDRLADLPHQDTNNYGLGDVYLGAADDEELEQRWQECLRWLRFEFDPPPDEGSEEQEVGALA